MWNGGLDTRFAPLHGPPSTPKPATATLRSAPCLPATDRHANRWCPYRDFIIGTSISNQEPDEPKQREQDQREARRHQPGVQLEEFPHGRANPGPTTRVGEPGSRPGPALTTLLRFTRTPRDGHSTPMWATSSAEARATFIHPGRTFVRARHSVHATTHHEIVCRSGHVTSLGLCGTSLGCMNVRPSWAKPARTPLRASRCLTGWSSTSRRALPASWESGSATAPVGRGALGGTLLVCRSNMAGIVLDSRWQSLVAR